MSLNRRPPKISRRRRPPVLHGTRWAAPWNCGYIDTIGQPAAILRSDIGRAGGGPPPSKITYERLIKFKPDDAGVQDKPSPSS